jgi:spermidine synthase
VREFGNGFGNTIHSASLVIAVFMGGLGVGSYVAGRWADRRYVDRPGSLLTAYGWVELGIAGLGLLVMLLPRLGDVSAAISSYTGDTNGWYVLSLGSYLTRYTIGVVLLAPITMLMGTTLTLLIRHQVQQDLSVAGWRIAALYAVNTAGAALGAFLTDYLEYYGPPATIRTSTRVRFGGDRAAAVASSAYLQSLGGFMSAP